MNKWSVFTKSSSYLTSCRQSCLPAWTSPLLPQPSPTVWPSRKEPILQPVKVVYSCLKGHTQQGDKSGRREKRKKGGSFAISGWARALCAYKGLPETRQWECSLRRASGTASWPCQLHGKHGLDRGGTSCDSSSW